jgi:hypothetical protein
MIEISGRGPDTARGISSLPGLCTGSEAHTASYSIGNWAFFRKSAKLIIRVRLGVKLRTVEIRHAPPHKLSWFGIEEKKDFKFIIIII